MIHRSKMSHADTYLTMRHLIEGKYQDLHSLDDLRAVLQSGQNLSDVMQRLNPTVWVPAVRVLGMQRIPDMLIVMAISLAGLLAGTISMYLILRFCLGGSKHPRLQLATHTRSNAVHVTALSLKILFIIAGMYIALGSVGIDPINVALSLGVVAMFVTVAFQRVGIQVAATFTVTGGGYLAEGMVIVAGTRVGIIKGEIVAIGTYNTLVQGVIVGGIVEALGLREGEQMVFYIPNSDFVDGSWARMPMREDDVTSTNEGKPTPPPDVPVTLQTRIARAEDASDGYIGRLVRYVRPSGKPSSIKRVRIPRKMN